MGQRPVQPMRIMVGGAGGAQAAVVVWGEEEMGILLGFAGEKMRLLVIETFWYIGV